MNEVALFQSALRAAVPTQPDPALGRELVPRLAGLARAATIEAEGGVSRGRPRSRFALVARIAIAVALIPLILAGLAFAGVTVPGPARDAFDSLGVTLPNQPSENADEATRQGQPQDTGNDVSDAAKSGTHRGKGGNSAAAHQHALQQRSKAKGKATGHTRGKAIGLNDATPPGQAGQTGASNSNAGGSSSSHSQSSSAPRANPHPFSPGTSRGRGLARGHSR